MPDLTHEAALIQRGYRWVAGVDEAGRGPLAGPVTAAAVILPGGFDCPGLDDSKKLSRAKRDELYALLTSNDGVIWAVALATSQEIDRLNILRASHLAMERAITALTQVPDHCLIDGLPIRGFRYPHDALVKGDQRSLSIAAASVLAKVTRDRLMDELDQEYPQFGFAQHHGYGTKAHLEALRIHGPCCHHRSSFEPVAQPSLPFDLF